MKKLEDLGLYEELYDIFKEVEKMWESIDEIESKNEQFDIVVNSAYSTGIKIRELSESGKYNPKEIDRQAALATDYFSGRFRGKIKFTFELTLGIIPRKDTNENPEYN